jgi:NAD(P)-dependent dehydrogenase (short-subunit alcohol dehydrogenase family)
VAKTPVALVSGANRGIGAEIASQLADDHGFLVLAGSRDISKIDETDSIRAVELDVASEASVEAARTQVESDPGRLDVLVNNAGIGGSYDGVAEYDWSALRAVAYAGSMLRDRGLAEEVVQDCCYRLLKKSRVYDLQRDGAKLLLRSVTNACISHNRQVRRTVDLNTWLESDDTPVHLVWV